MVGMCMWCMCECVSVGGIRTHGNLAVLAFLSAMKWPVISELRHIIGLVVPASGGGVSGCGHTTWCVWHLDTESGTVFPSNLFCSSGMAWTLRTCRTGWGDKETHTGREREREGEGRGSWVDKMDTHSSGVLDIVLWRFSSLQQLQ